MTAPTQWHKLDRDRTIAMIDRVKTSDDHILFSLATSEAKCARLPFYKDLLLYRLTNYSSLPSFSFDYVGDGKIYFYLDGSSTAVYAINDSGTLSLNEQNVVEYLTFFFEHVSGPDGDIFLIDEPQNNPALDSLNAAQRDDIIAYHQPPEVSTDAQGNYVVVTSLYYLGSLVRASVIVGPQGHVSVSNQQTLLTMTSDTYETGYLT